MDAEDLEVHPAMIVSLEVGTVNFECSVEIRAYMIEHRSGSFSFFFCVLRLDACGCSLNALFSGD